MDHIPEQIEEIDSKEAFCNFLMQLAADYRKKPQEWESKTVDEVMEAMASWIEDYSASPSNDIDWGNVRHSLLAKILYMGKLYE